MGSVFRRKYRDPETGKCRRCKTYTIRYTDGHGNRYQESADTTDEARARALLRERETAVWEGRHFPEKNTSAPLTLGELHDLWLRERAAKQSIRHDRTRLGAAVKHFGRKRLIAAITSAEVRTWRDALAEGRKVATVNRYMAVLRAAFRLATQLGYKHRDPMRGIKLPAERNARDRVCSPAEYGRLLAAADADLGACITIGYWCGMRLGEIVGLRRDRIDLDTGLLRVAAADTKEATAKVVPLPSAVVAVIKALPKHAHGRVLRYKRSERYSHAFAVLCGKLEPPILDLHFHDLRHTALTNMADAGLDVLTMAAISGHKTLAMLKRYVHRSPAALRAAMARVEAHAAASAAAAPKADESGSSPQSTPQP